MKSHSAERKVEIGDVATKLHYVVTKDRREMQRFKEELKRIVPEYMPQF